MKIRTVNDEIAWARKWVSDQFETIAQMDNELYRKILILSVVDSIVQHQINVGSKNQKEFATFLQNYSSAFNGILRSYCPTTMYYDNLQYLQGESLHLEISRIYCVDEREVIDEANRLLSLLNQQSGAKTERHQYAWLIYAMRNKLVHEMSIVGCDASFLTEDSDPIPHLVVLNRHDHSEISPYKWTLMIPEKFIWTVGRSAIDNYLIECETLQKHPLDKMDTFRKSRFAWYD